MPFCLSVFPTPEGIGPAQTGRGFWALTLPEVPDGQAGVSSPTAGGSHGLRPFQGLQPASCTGPNPRSSHALRGTPTLRSTTAGTSEYQSTPTSPRRLRLASQTHPPGQPS